MTRKLQSEIQSSWHQQPMLLMLEPQFTLLCAIGLDPHLGCSSQRMEEQQLQGGQGKPHGLLLAVHKLLSHATSHSFPRESCEVLQALFHR